MNKTIHFIAGMPQAGSSLLACILAQNPRFGCGMPGGVLEQIYSLAAGWSEIAEFKTAPNDAGKLGVMRGMLQGFYADSDRPIAFDRSRGWLAHLEMAEVIAGGAVKVLVPVRDLREILASFELLWRRNSAYQQVPLEKKYYHDFQSVQGRCARWFSAESPIGLAYARIQDAIHRQFRDRLHFVRYESLVSQPVETLKAIYDFLGEPRFEHDLNSIRQVVPASDALYGFDVAHEIEAKLRPFPPRAATVLGGAAQQYKGPYIWDIASTQPLPK